jgi:hypothetical protein
MVTSGNISLDAGLAATIIIDEGGWGNNEWMKKQIYLLSKRASGICTTICRVGRGLSTSYAMPAYTQFRLF